MDQDAVLEGYKALLDSTNEALKRAVSCIYAEREYVRTHAWAFSDPEALLDRLEYKLASVHEATYHARRCEEIMHGLP